MSLVDVARKVLFNSQIRELLLKAFDGKPLVDSAGNSLYPQNPFTKLVQFQIDKCGGATELHDRGFQPGEPFTGDIEHAKILFVSSNPAYNQNEDSPFYHAEDDSIVLPQYDFLKRTPSSSPQKIYSYGNVRDILNKYFFVRLKNAPLTRSNAKGIPLLNDPDYAGGVTYWTSVRNFIAELMVGNPVFALTEIVPYRSSREAGVSDAIGIPEAVNESWKTIRELIASSSVKVIVLVGNKSEKVFREKKQLEQVVDTEASLPYRQRKKLKTEQISLYIQDIGGMDRLIVKARYRQGNLTSPSKYFSLNSKILIKIRQALS